MEPGLRATERPEEARARAGMYAALRPGMNVTLALIMPAAMLDSRCREGIPGPFQGGGTGTAVLGEGGGTLGSACQGYVLSIREAAIRA